MPSVSQLRRVRSNKSLLPLSTASDPLSLALLPPADETPTSRAARIQAEKDAKARSDEIDRLLSSSSSSSSSSAVVGKKSGRTYKMVLLGQAGAGKTTVLKQMRLLYDPTAHERERKGWGKIVVLNLVASIRVLLEALQGSAAGQGESGEENKVVSQHLVKVKELEQRLRVELGAFGEETVLSSSTATSSGNGGAPLVLRSGWQERLLSCARRSISLAAPSPASSVSGSMQPQPSTEEDGLTRETLLFLRTLSPDILHLWTENSSVKMLKRKGIFLDSATSESATTYFLDNLPRIISSEFTPRDSDILHSRVRTLGVTECTFHIDKTLTYTIYDVGGSQSQRHAWVPFLSDQLDAIIFLAPLSSFNQTLTEDPTTNRLADTFALFNTIVSNPLLRRTTIILFLNKIDLLEKKLKNGTKLSDFWREYDGDNDFEAVWRWFRAKFRDALRRAEEEGGKRRLYVHTTVATSTKQLGAILMSVRDAVLRENLKVTGLVG